MIALVFEQMLLEAFETDRLEKPRGNDPVGVDVLAADRESRAADVANPLNGQATPPPARTPAYASARVMLVNANFGCGSSREHAPQAIYRRGIRAVIGQSFSEIFFGNSVALGLPCPTASRETLNALMSAVEQNPSTEIAVDLQAMRVTAQGRSYELTLPAAARDSFLDGTWDATGLLLEDFDQVRAVAARLPYVAESW